MTGKKGLHGKELHPFAGHESIEEDQVWGT
jgi:hypothetical protein